MNFICSVCGETNPEEAGQEKCPSCGAPRTPMLSRATTLGELMDRAKERGLPLRIEMRQTPDGEGVMLYRWPGGPILMLTLTDDGNMASVVPYGKWIDAPWMPEIQAEWDKEVHVFSWTRTDEEGAESSVEMRSGVWKRLDPDGEDTTPNCKSPDAEAPREEVDLPHK